MEIEEPLSAEIESLVGELFGDRADDARDLLLCYGDREANRVRLGILKLSDGDLDLLAHYADRALNDYRDILYWAEYPDEISRGGDSPDSSE